MADPLTITTGVISLVAQSIKVVQAYQGYASKYNIADLAIISLRTECACIRIALGRIQDIFINNMISSRADVENRFDTYVLEEYEAVLGACSLTFSILNERLTKLLPGDVSKENEVSAKSKLKYAWKEQDVDQLRQYISRQVAAVTLLLNAFQAETTTKTYQLLAEKNNTTILKSVSDDARTLRTSLRGESMAGEEYSIKFPTLGDGELDFDEAKKPDLGEAKEFDFDEAVKNSYPYRRAMTAKSPNSSAYQEAAPPQSDPSLPSTIAARAASDARPLTAFTDRREPRDESEGGSRQQILRPPTRAESIWERGDMPCCDSPSSDIWWCHMCEILFCDTCWETQVVHSSRAPNSGAHQKTELALARVILSILGAGADPKSQIKLHEENHKTKWFEVRGELGLPSFCDFGRYSRLVVGMGGGDDTQLQYPSLTSFVGETGSGKSTLISTLVKIKATRNLVQGPTPAIGTGSSGVHLFADPSTYNERRPYFYADCEGFHGNSPVLSSVRGGDAQVAMSWARKREISWLTRQQCSRQWTAENIYPRVLFTFSDTICFVMRNARVLENTFSKLIMWAEKAFAKSINQPMLPHAIIVINAVDVEDPTDANDLWDVDSLTRKQLKIHEDCIRQNPELRQIKDNWEKLGKNVKTLGELLRLYFGDIKIICIPHGRLPPGLIKKQFSSLYGELKNSSDAAMVLRARSGLQMTSGELGYYLESAFGHFSQSGNEPFDFLAAAVQRYPITQTFKDHILRVAVLLLTLHISWSGQEIFAKMSRLVASCIFLDSKRKHYPQTELFSKYRPSCEQAQNEFYEYFWPCEYMDSRGRRCVNISIGHSKGHQLNDGRVFATGHYFSTYHGGVVGRDAFVDAVQQEFTHLKEQFHQEVGGNMDRATHVSDAASFHLEQSLAPFVKDCIPDSGSLESHNTCFVCLFDTPVHVLYCGHVLCHYCIINFSGKQSAHEVEITVCPLCPRSNSPWDVPWKLQLMPPYSGLRVLSLDGGGVRGIIQLTILEILEEQLDLDMPIQRFFDLIVGTSTGGIVALALGSNLMTVKECKKIFRVLCKRSFTKSILVDTPGLEGIVRSSGLFLYKSKELEKALQDVFEKKPIFGGKQSLGGPSQLKVGVISTSSSGHPYLHANYNRDHSKEGELLRHFCLLSTEGIFIDTPYVFLRGENHKEELEIWEAARASSAVPTYFKPFYDKKTGRTLIDGGLCFNNPVQVANSERKLLWPHLPYEPLALFLSIGTGFNLTHSEQAWEDFTRPLNLREKDNSQKYCRLNLEYGGDLPKFDDVGQIALLEETTRLYFLQNKLIDQVVDTLMASLFYFRLNTTRRDQDSDTKWDCQGTILCQLPQGSIPLKKLCKKLWQLKSSSIAMFLVEERPYSDLVIPYPDDEFLNGIENGSPFALDITMTVYEGEDSRIYLRLFNGRRGLIGGFPRSLIKMPT